MIIIEIIIPNIYMMFNVMNRGKHITNDLVCPIQQNLKLINIPKHSFEKVKLNITHRSKTTHLKRFFNHINTEINKTDEAEEIKDIKIETFYKERNPIKFIHLNNTNYFNEVFNNEHTVIIFYYIENCTYCKKIYKILQDINQEHPYFNIKLLNFNEHPINHPNLKITHVPTVALLQKNNKNYPIVFKNNYTYENYLTFIKNNWI